MPRRIVISVINDLTGDQRIHRIASTLAAAGYEVLVIGRKLPESLPVSPRPYQTHRMRLWFRRGKVFYVEYNLRLFLLLLKTPADAFNANDLDTLLANFMAATLRRIPLLYDTHEYFTEVPELVSRRWTRSIWVLLERWIFPRLRYVYTVNPSLARIYESRYKVPVRIIRNLPYRQPPHEMRRGTDPPYILLYQGALNMGRGIPLMIKALEHLPEDYHLWIIGKGDVALSLQTLASHSPAKDRIDFKGFVPLEALPSYTRKAHIGFSLEEDLGGNYHYASPNKLYDYIQAQVPVIVSDLPEMRQIVETHKVGTVLLPKDRKPAQLAAIIREMMEDGDFYEFWKANCVKAAATLNWEKEKQTLLELYKKALNPLSGQG